MIVLKISISGREHLLHLTCVTNPAPGEGGRSIVTDSPMETASDGEVYVPIQHCCAVSEDRRVHSGPAKLGGPDAPLTAQQPCILLDVIQELLEIKRNCHACT